MVYTFAQKVLFKHCDPAGIVFFPRYFEMMNDCVESFFDSVLGLPFEVLMKQGGVPTAQIETRFAAPSRHGDHLSIALQITNVSSRSASYLMRATCADQLRFETTATLVHVGPDGRATPWPEALQTRLTAFKDDTP